MYVYVCVCVCVCVCVYVYIYIYVYMHTHTHTHTGNTGAEYASRRRGVIASVRFYYWLYLLYLKSTNADACGAGVSESSCVVDRSLDFRWTPSEQEVFFLLASVSEFVRESLFRLPMNSVWAGGFTTQFTCFTIAQKYNYWNSCGSQLGTHNQEVLLLSLLALLAQKY